MGEQENISYTVAQETPAFFDKNCSQKSGKYSLGKGLFRQPISTWTTGFITKLDFPKPEIFTGYPAPKNS